MAETMGEQLIEMLLGDKQQATVRCPQNCAWGCQEVTEVVWTELPKGFTGQ